MARKSSRIATKAEPKSTANEDASQPEGKLAAEEDRSHESRSDDDFEDAVPIVTNRKRKTQPRMTSKERAPRKKRIINRSSGDTDEADTTPICLGAGEYLEITIPDPTVPEVQSSVPKTRPNSTQAGRVSKNGP